MVSVKHPDLERRFCTKVWPSANHAPDLVRLATKLFTRGSEGQRTHRSKVGMALARAGITP
jgi:hypothetical protein